MADKCSGCLKLLKCNFFGRQLLYHSKISLFIALEVAFPLQFQFTLKFWYCPLIVIFCWHLKIAHFTVLKLNFRLPSHLTNRQGWCQYIQWSTFVTIKPTENSIIIFNCSLEPLAAKSCKLQGIATQIKKPCLELIILGLAFTEPFKGCLNHQVRFWMPILWYNAGYF